MSRIAREKSNSGIYHIMLRGSNRQEIFHDDKDAAKFLEILSKYKAHINFEIFAWCLMGNHVHILLKEGNEDISVSLKRIGVSYVAYYNAKYKTVGHLFQDRFLSETVDTEEYLITVIRYIHQNPLKAGLVNRNEEWEYSSCKEYYDMENNYKGLLDKEFILNIFDDNMSLATRKFIEFNEENNNNKCLEDDRRKRISDDEARKEILKLISVEELTGFKNMNGSERNEIIKVVKTVRHMTQRQAARILGISPNLVFKN